MFKSNMSSYRFFSIFERQFPSDIYERFLYILTQLDWKLMGNYFWISHIVHLLLHSAASHKGQLNEEKCAKFTRTFEKIVSKILPTLCAVGGENEQISDVHSIILDDTDASNSRISCDKKLASIHLLY